MTVTQKITPFLWFDTEAEAAADFYVSIFPNSRVLKVLRYGEAGPGPAGSAMLVVFELDGQEFNALNGGPMYRFNESVSFVINCETQAEVDRMWTALTADGGQPGRCGWLKDRFGLSWQVTPVQIRDTVGGPDPEGARRATEAMMQMDRLDVAELERAYRGG